MDEVFTCPVCGKTSSHPDDVAEGYCGHCHDWTGKKIWSRKEKRRDQPQQP